MSAVSIFESDGWSVRGVEVNGEPWFVATDVCRALEIGNPSQAVARLDADDLSSSEVIDSMGRTQVARTVNEAGLYELVLASRKPEARKFKRWITHEVIPAIRRTGRYEVEPPAPRYAIPQTYAEALMAAAQLAAEGERKDALIAELEPAARFAERLSNAEGDFDVRAAAQMLCRDKTIRVGQNRLFDTLRRLGWIDTENRPYQHRIDAGLLAERTREAFTDREGRVHVTHQTRVTVKGLRALHKELGGTGPLMIAVQGDLPGTWAS